MTKDTCECQFDNDMIYKTEMTNKAYGCNCGGTREKYIGQVLYLSYINSNKSEWMKKKTMNVIVVFFNFTHEYFY